MIGMHDTDEVLLAHLISAERDFSDRLRAVRPDQWAEATPCSEWTVRELVSHMVQANLIYTLLLQGGSGEQFLTIRERDTLGSDPVAAFESAAAECLTAFGEPHRLDRIVDYPFGPVPGRQLVGLLLADTVVHTWDLARASGLDDQLTAQLVEWVLANIEWIFRGVSDSPIASPNSHRYFAAPAEFPPSPASPQDSLLHLMGRRP